MHPEEKAFREALDSGPEDVADRNTLLVFADWLAERNDPREMGYRALAAAGLRANRMRSAWWYNAEGLYRDVKDRPECSKLPGDWYHATRRWTDLNDGDCCGWLRDDDADASASAEDAAALAFLRLPPSRQSELLALAQEAAA